MIVEGLTCPKSSKQYIMDKTTKWLYLLPDGTVETNMKDAKIKLGISKTRLIGMLKSGTVTRIMNPKSETLKGYENDTTGTIK